MIVSLKNYNFIQYINYSLIGYAFTMSFSKAGVNLFTILIILFWLLDANFKAKFIELRSNKLIVALTTFILFSFIAALFADQKIESLLYVKKYFHLFVIFIIYTSLEIKYIKHIFSAFLLGMMLSIMMSYGIFFELWSYKDVIPSDPSPFMSRTDYSIFLAFASLLVLNKFYFESDFKIKLYYLIYFVAAVGNLFVNAGRTGQVGFVLGLFAIGFLNIKNKLKAILIMMSILFSILYLAYNFSYVFKERFDSTIYDVQQMVYENNYSGGLGQRVAIWRVGVDIFSDNILFGKGILNEMTDVKEYVEKLNIKYEYLILTDFHNLFIQYAVQLGIFGLVIIVMIFLFLMKNRFVSSYYRNLNILFLILFTLWSFGGLTLHLMNSMIFFALFAGVFNAISNINNNTKHTVKGV